MASCTSSAPSTPKTRKTGSGARSRRCPRGRRMWSPTFACIRGRRRNQSPRSGMPVVGAMGKLLHTAVIAALLLVSCDRRPQPDQDGASTKPTPAVGTAGASVPAGPQPPNDEPKTAVQRDPEAIKALENMSTYLRGLKAFQIRSETSRDEVLDDGQTVAFAGVVDMIVERPNRLRAEVTSDKQQRFYFADGKTFNVWARRVNYYPTIPAPPTLRELADTLVDKYDLELPLADLFY